MGYLLQWCSREEWIQKLNELPSTHPAFPVKFLMENAVFSGTLSSLPKLKTEERLDTLGIKPAEVTEPIIVKSLEFLAANGNLPKVVG